MIGRLILAKREVPIKYNQPFGISDPNAVYVNGNPATGTMGSIPPAASIEYPQRELVNFFSTCGLVPDNADLQQLSKSVQTGHVIFGIDTGSVNSLSVALSPPLAGYLDGMFVWVKAGNTNTGPSVVSINGLASRNIVRRGGAVLQSGDIPAGYYSLLVYNSTHSNFELYGIGFGAGSGFLPILTANTVLYVNGTTGDDVLYDGTAATISGPHGPFATINRAMTETFKYGPSIYTMTINIAAGTYPESIATPPIVGPTTVLNGAGKTLTVISGNPAGPHTINCNNNNNMTIQNLAVKTTNVASGNSCCISTSGGNLTINNCAIGGPGSATNGYLIDAVGGNINVQAVDINGGACLSVFVAFTNGNLIFTGSAVINNLGALTCNAYVSCSGGSNVSSSPTPLQPNFGSPGFITGAKYIANLNGVINTQGQSTSFFPGTIAGSLATGGQYG